MLYRLSFTPCVRIFRNSYACSLTNNLVWILRSLLLRGEGGKGGEGWRSQHGILHVIKWFFHSTQKYLRHSVVPSFSDGIKPSKPHYKAI